MNEYSIRAKKSLGQNFLIDPEALSDIASSLEITGKNIIEVGPGYGALTEYILSEKPAHLSLVEVDTDMISILQERFSDTVDIYHQDVLWFEPKYKEYSVIANIPYYITSPILFHFLYNLPTPPEEMVIMMQKEVGEKILAEGKKRHYSFLSLAMYEACSHIDPIRIVPRTSFDPAPKVDSIVLRFIIHPDRDNTLEKSLLELWKRAFVHPRKTLLSNLKSFYDEKDILSWLTQNGYESRVRAEAIEKEHWKSFPSLSNL
jgi:16S rRNA (adenine1518-N6/adenine1519-N6)-dimethyltransferase